MSDQHLRKEIKDIGRQSGVYMFGQALSSAVSFVMIPVYTRHISPGGYGAMELIEILTAGLTLFVSMGVSETMARFYYQEKTDERRNLVVSTVILGFAPVAGLLVAASILGAPALSRLLLESPDQVYYLRVALASVWFGLLGEIGASYLRMVYKAGVYVTITIGKLMLALSLNIAFVVHLKMGILGVFYSTLISQAAAAVVMLAYIGSRVPLLGFSLPVFRRAVSFGLPLVPSRIALLFGFASNRFFLKWLASPDPALALAQVGLYSLGHKFGLVVNRFVTVPFNSFWGPRRIDLLVSEAPDARRTLARICTYSTLATVYIALLVSAGAETVISLMADPAYRGAHTVVPMVALAYVSLGLETHFTAGLLYAKRTAWTVYISFASILVILAVNYLAIPPFGIVGAALANLAGFAVRVFLSYAVSQHFLPVPFEIGRLSSIFVVSAGLFAAVQFLSNASPYVTLAMRLGGVALFPALLALGGFFTAGEREMVRAAVRRGGLAVHRVLGA